MEKIQTSDFKDLRVWQQSMDMVVDVYNTIKTLPIEEKFALADQIRRCSVSIPSNIAEGQARRSNKEFLNFLSIARGSIAELQTQLLLCFRLGYVSEDIISSLNLRLKVIDKMISGLMMSLSHS